MDKYKYYCLNQGACCGLQGVIQFFNISHRFIILTLRISNNPELDEGLNLEF
jgi:hypothetical protein